MIRKRAELDTVNPPGQSVNRPPAHMEYPLVKEIQKCLHPWCDCPDTCVMEDKPKPFERQGVDNAG